MFCSSYARRVIRLFMSDIDDNNTMVYLIQFQTSPNKLFLEQTLSFQYQSTMVLITENLSFF